MPHYLQSDSNTMNPSRIRRCMIEPEEIWSKNSEEKESSMDILQGCENSQPAKFSGCKISQHCFPAHCIDCFLTRLFMVLYKFSLDVIFVHLHTFVISLVLSIYISSMLLVNQSTFDSINQSRKLSTKLPLPLLVFVIFSPSPSFSCIFSLAKHPLMMTNQGMLG